jgi:hypothetical protein
MKKLLAAALALACAGGYAQAATDTECAALWKQADTNGDNVLTGAEADRYLAWMRVQDRSPPSDGRITAMAFNEACLADTFKARATDAGAPLKGANSFTEGQARDRAAAAGFTEISEMKKDDNGIWRGSASREGKSVNIAVDYKGNVVAQGM